MIEKLHRSGTTKKQANDDFLDKDLIKDEAKKYSSAMKPRSNTVLIKGADKKSVNFSATHPHTEENKEGDAELDFRRSKSIAAIMSEKTDA